MDIAQINHIIGLSYDEIQRQYKKWGMQNHSLIEWNAILVEEVGEASKEILEDHFSPEFYQLDPERGTRIQKEIVQVIAVCIRMILQNCK